MTYGVTWARAVLAAERVAPVDWQHAAAVLRRMSGYELDRGAAVELVAILDNETVPVQAILTDTSATPAERAVRAVRWIELYHPDVQTAGVDDLRERVAAMTTDTSVPPPISLLDTQEWEPLLIYPPISAVEQTDPLAGEDFYWPGDQVPVIDRMRMWARAVFRHPDPEPVERGAGVDA